jgi:hypothetical protein
MIGTCLLLGADGVLGLAPDRINRKPAASVRNAARNRPAKDGTRYGTPLFRILSDYVRPDAQQGKRN